MKFRNKKEIINPYTVEQCKSCTAITKRQFKEGDYVFRTTDKCMSCNNGLMMITKIFGELVK